MGNASSGQRRMAGKIALVAGAASGIGRATALLWPTRAPLYAAPTLVLEAPAPWPRSSKRPPGASAYSASKAAVCMFVKAAAKECLQNGDRIRVNTVCPGGVKTPLWRDMSFFRDLVETTGSEEAAFQELAKSDPQGRFAEPEEIAQAVLYLASDDGSGDRWGYTA